jgi:hypothetical protein
VRTLPPRRLRHAPIFEEQLVPTTSGHISDVAEPDPGKHSDLRRWARNVGAALLALILFMATWVTAIGWNDQPPTSERLRARRAAARAVDIDGAGAPQNAPASERTIDASRPANPEEIGTRTEALRPVRAPSDNRSAGSRARAADRPTPAAPASDLDLRLTR